MQITYTVRSRIDKRRLDIDEPVETVRRQPWFRALGKEPSLLIIRRVTKRYLQRTAQFRDGAAGSDEPHRQSLGSLAGTLDRLGSPGTGTKPAKPTSFVLLLFLNVPQ